MYVYTVCLLDGSQARAGVAGGSAAAAGVHGRILQTRAPLDIASDRKESRRQTEREAMESGRGGERRVSEQRK